MLFRQLLYELFAFQGVPSVCRWMTSYLQLLTVNTQWGGGGCPQDYPQSFIPAKVRHCGQTAHKSHPRASPQWMLHQRVWELSSASGTHFRGPLKRKCSQKLEVGRLGSPTSPRALIRRPSMQGGISSSFLDEVSIMFASLRN